MKKTIIITSSFIAAFLLLYVFNKLTSKKEDTAFYTEVKKGDLEIAITAAGELVAERSVEIKGPEFAQRRDVRSTRIKIQDLIPEGTLVEKGDFIATLDRTELNNDLKDQQERLVSFQTNLDMKLLDTAIVLNSLRDDIKNQKFLVEEATLTYKNSKYESPTVIRQAEIALEKSKRILEQKQRNYKRRLAQSKTDIFNQRYWVSRIQQRVTDLEEVLAGFTITAPSRGMIIYKKEWNGTKRKVGSNINTMDRVVATLPDLSSLLSKTFVSEVDVSKVKPGQIVNLTIDAFPKKKFNGVVLYVANIGEKLPNTNDKVFEVQIRLNESDPALRPSMTTGNKIMIKEFNDVVYIPIECVRAGMDSVTYVYKKDKTKQVVLLGESNEKYVIIEKGLSAGSQIYQVMPESPEKFDIAGEDIIPVIKERERLRKIENKTYSNRMQGIL